jgi:hypothetical protein
MPVLHRPLEPALRLGSLTTVVRELTHNIEVIVDEA